MGKVKSEVCDGREVGDGCEVGDVCNVCIVCDSLYPRKRAELGYRTCTECGEALARKTKHTIVQEYSKGPYQVVTNFAILKQTNPKRQ